MVEGKAFFMLYWPLIFHCSFSIKFSVSWLARGCLLKQYLFICSNLYPPFPRRTHNMLCMNTDCLQSVTLYDHTWSHLILNQILSLPRLVLSTLLAGALFSVGGGITLPLNTEGHTFYLGNQIIRVFIWKPCMCLCFEQFLIRPKAANLLYSLTFCQQKTAPLSFQWNIHTKITWKIIPWIYKR